MLYLGFFALVIGGAIGYYMWNKPHEAIGKPDFSVTATQLAADFGTTDEMAAIAMKKYAGQDGKMIVIQVSGKITDVKSDTSGVTIALDTGDPMNGVSCVLDKFTKNVRTDYKVGEEVKLKGLCTGKLSDVILDRCVAAE